MRKLFTIFSLVMMVVLVGCATTLNSTKNGTTTGEQTSNVSLNTDHSLAFSTYMASGLLSMSNSSSNLNLSTKAINNYKLVTLSDTETTTEEELVIETELEEVNIYFDKLKVFMGEGVDSVLNITEQASTIEGYDYEVTYTIEGVTYTIYYSFVDLSTETDQDNSTEESTTTNLSNTTVEEEDDDKDEEENEDLDDDKDEEENDDLDDDKDEEEFQLVGLMVIDGVRYELTGANEIDGTEQKMWFETSDTTDSGNYVRVVIKNEDGEQKFELETVIDGVESRSKIKFVQEENETKVDFKLIQGEEESSYVFKKEVEDGVTTYKFKYQIGDVEGEVKIIEMTDAEGNITYKYDIKEEGKHKEIEKEDRSRKDKEHGKGKSDQDESGESEEV